METCYTGSRCHLLGSVHVFKWDILSLFGILNHIYLCLDPDRFARWRLSHVKMPMCQHTRSVRRGRPLMAAVSTCDIGYISCVSVNVDIRTLRAGHLKPDVRRGSATSVFVKYPKVHRYRSHRSGRTDIGRAAGCVRPVPAQSNADFKGPKLSTLSDRAVRCCFLRKREHETGDQHITLPPIVFDCILCLADFGISLVKPVSIFKWY